MCAILYILITLLLTGPVTAQSEVHAQFTTTVPGQLIQAHYQNRQWLPGHWARHRKNGRWIAERWKYWGYIPAHYQKPYQVSYHMDAYRVDPKWHLGLFARLGGMTDPGIIRQTKAKQILGTVYFYQGILRGKCCEVPADFLLVHGKVLGDYQTKLRRRIFYFDKDDILNHTDGGPKSLPKGTTDAFALDGSMPDSDTARPRQTLCQGWLPDVANGGRLTRYTMSIRYTGTLYAARAIAASLHTGSNTGNFDAGHSCLASTPKVGGMLITWCPPPVQIASHK